MIVFKTITMFYCSFIDFLLQKCLANRKDRNEEKCQIEDLCDTFKVDSELIFISFIQGLLLIFGKYYLLIFKHHHFDM